MAARASPRRSRRPPSPPASDNDMPAGLQSFFALTSPPPTAPPSLPVSPPDSPVTRNTRPKESQPKSSSKRLKSERSSRGDAATPSSSSSKQHGQLSPDDSPILPRVKMAFPPILSDDDDWSPLVGGGPEDGARWGAQAGAASGSGGGGRRTWSQTTTTTTRKTEHRSYRYSMPSFDQLYSDHDLPPPPKSTSAKSPSHAQPHLAPSSSSPSPRNSSSSNINGPPSTRHSFSASKQSRTRSPSTASPSRKRTASPAARGFRSSLPSRRATSLHTTFGESPLQYSHSLSPRPCSPSDHPLEPAFFASDTLTTTTHNFFKPIMSLFAFLVVSTVACFSISAVLLASFSLTFYDDCGRRVGAVQRSIGTGRRRFRGSIEGVKTGMERVVGGARGALELAVWAAGAKKPEVRAAPTMVMSDLEDGSENEERDLSPAPLPSTKAGSKASRTRSRTRRRRSTAGAATSGRRPNLDRSFNSTSDAPFDPSNADAAETASYTPSQTNTWTDDEDAPPYEVPHTTPWGSRPPSAPPYRRSSRPSSSTGGSPRPDALPPRPPLKILIPSVLFALLYTFVKVVWALWREERGAGPGWYERTRAASKARGRR